MTGAVLLGALLVSGVRGVVAATPTEALPGSRFLADYFRLETERLEGDCLSGVRTLDDWKARRDRLRTELQDMLGLQPWPERGDLHAKVTGRVEGDGFSVENLHYQSLPGLYVTANLYLPKAQTQPAPAVLYLCGHARVATNGVSFGNKTFYQHHGEWWARHGYVCLTLDTIQLGELEGVHHGTYRESMWWWNARGYTPAGVEAWNGIRALDYLETRPEVDRQRLGVTGRSGGGAYSWWIAALDDRIRVAAPVAGITDLHNHVIDGTVEGHCDCMFMVNTYRWDYAQVAALVAPRPLLLANSDKDTIFPLDGVLRIHKRLRGIYELYGASTNLGLLITEGPHADTQDLQVPVFRWFNRHLLGQDPVIADAAERRFEPAALRVFQTLPADERTTRIHETFVPVAPSPELPVTRAAWEQQSARWMDSLRRHVFNGWPRPEPPVAPRLLEQMKGRRLRLETWTVDSQPAVPLTLVVLRPAGNRPLRSAVLRVVDDSEWTQVTNRFRSIISGSSSSRNPDRQALAALPRKDEALLVLAVRGIGPGKWAGDNARQTQIRRRFMLLGQTLEGMRVWDVVQAVRAIRRIPGLDRVPLTVEAQGALGVDALYASLFVDGIARLELAEVPASHRTGPDYLNVLRVLDIPIATALAAGRTPLRLHSAQAESRAWEYPEAVGQRLGWSPDRFEVIATSSTGR